MLFEEVSRVGKRIVQRVYLLFYIDITPHIQTLQFVATENGTARLPPDFVGCWSPSWRGASYCTVL